MSINDFNRLYAPPDYINRSGEIISNDAEIVNFIRDNNNKAKSFLRSNRGWKDADSCMAIFYGDEVNKPALGLSKVTVKKLRRQAREAIANVTNVRPKWLTRSEKGEYADQEEIYDKLKDHWWFTKKIQGQIKKACQYGGGGPKGYLFLWPEQDHFTGKWNISARPLSWKQVLPYHAGVEATIDNVFGITVHLELPVPEAHLQFPKHIEIIKPDRDVPGFFNRGFERVKRTFKGVYDRFGTNRTNTVIAEDPYPAADIYYTWISDPAINETGKTLIMGKNGEHWSYKVPSFYCSDGSIAQVDIVTGKVVYCEDSNWEDATNLVNNRLITIKECKLFPYQRMIISTNYGIIWDGPPRFLNRYRPIVPFTFEEVVGEFLGISLIRDGRKLEESANRMLQALEDAIVGRISPPVAISDRIPKPIRAMLRRNMRQLIGKVFEYNPALMEKALVPLLSPEFFNIDARAIEIIKYNQDTQDYLMGTNDSSFMNKLGQMPASDTQEAYIRSLGALATDQAIGIEESILQMARIFLDFAPQVYTTEQIIIWFGADLVAHAMDFDPNSIVPQIEKYPDCETFAERWQKHMKKFSVYASPFSMVEKFSQTRKLTFATLQKIGVPISNKRLYATFIDDGQYEETYNEWKKEQIDKTMIAAALQRMLQAANQEADPQNQMANHVANLVNSQNNEGRPNSFQEPPKMEMKSDLNGIPRSTVATSK